eukprot:6405784-Pyramimonas_sp.AAC.1
MRRNAGGPLAWHSKCKAEAPLRDSDAICQQHGLSCRLLGLATCYGQLNTAELATFEWVCRQTQLIEERHYRTPCRRRSWRRPIGLSWGPFGALLPGPSQGPCGLSWGGPSLGPHRLSCDDFGGPLGSPRSWQGEG